MKKIEDLRIDYTKFSMDEFDLLSNPIDQFNNWFKNALNSKVSEANAMVLSTVSSQSIPSARVVLLKGVQSNGFKFYTNYDSFKGKELAENPNACLTFFWPALEQQIRVTGLVEKIDATLSEAYFHSRPRGSQISALASNQSARIADRVILVDEVARLEKLYADTTVPKPEFWGGYLLKPTKVEFWQGRSSRLHDRFLYEKLEDDNWQVSRLSP
ncbi:pyridoxamine 5'-phosphate oxidase [Flavobacteriales bacterium]|nr:pyridoxamine 5'-phosphate oxidase [Flavobacteriales bacterium]MDA9017812.1 pyridoxamine 5'-phosphate oxidase [bacterium]